MSIDKGFVLDSGRGISGLYFRMVAIKLSTVLGHQNGISIKVVPFSLEICRLAESRFRDNSSGLYVDMFLKWVSP
jgi:hypothetical protein